MAFIDMPIELLNKTTELAVATQSLITLKLLNTNTGHDISVTVDARPVYQTPPTVQETKP